MSSPTAVADHLAKFSTKAERARLDEQPHFIPINLSILEITLGTAIIQNVEQIYDAETIEAAKAQYGDTWKAVLSKDSVISLQELKTTIENYVSNQHRNKIEVTNTGIKINGVINNSLSDIIDNYLPATVYSNGKIVGALYGSYKKAYSGLFKDFLNKEINKYLSRVVYKDSNYKIGFDVGHILGESSLASTPLGQKLRRILDILGGLTEGTLDIDGVSPQYISKNKQAITSLKTKVDSIFNKLAAGSTYGPKIEAEIKKDFDLNTLLVSIKANVVVFQDRYENQAVYANLLEGPLGAELIELLKTVNFSNNIQEQIAENITFTLLGKQVVRSKKVAPIKKSVPKKPVKVKFAKESGQNVSVKKLPKYSTKTYASLASLQTLLNLALAQQIHRNMGTGTSRNILNYRTGRLAESAQVTTLSQSREGMITAFYTYMRNPYGTFSEGGAQSAPRTRDPKLLISRSIREVLSTQVNNRLRAVLA